MTLEDVVQPCSNCKPSQIGLVFSKEILFEPFHCCTFFRAEHATCRDSHDSTPWSRSCGYSMLFTSCYTLTFSKSEHAVGIFGVIMALQAFVRSQGEEDGAPHGVMIEDQDSSNFWKAEADPDDSSSSSEEAGALHAPRPSRISLSSLFDADTRSQSQFGNGGNAVVGSSTPHWSPSQANAPCASGSSGDAVEDVSALALFLPTEADEIAQWHPNRIWEAVVHFVASRIEDPKDLKPLRRLRSKACDPIRTLRVWAQTSEPFGGLATGTYAQRMAGKRFFVKILSVTCSQSHRKVQAQADAMWQKLVHPDQYQWTRLRMIVMEPAVAPHVPELSEQPHVRPDSADADPSSKRARTTNDDTTSQRAKTGYGFVITYNSTLGQDNPEVIKAVQSGVKGCALRQKLKKLPVYTEAFEDLWLFTNAFAAQYHFDTVNVTLEHSEHGDHDARVHFHTFIGIDLSGGMGFVQTPAQRTIPAKEFEWHGIRPHVSPTMTNRKTWGAIYNAVATGAYYVAGPKSTVIVKRSTLEPIEDNSATETCYFMSCYV